MSGAGSVQVKMAPPPPPRAGTLLGSRDVSLRKGQGRECSGDDPGPRPSALEPDPSVLVSDPWAERQFLNCGVTPRMDSFSLGKLYTDPPSMRASITTPSPVHTAQIPSSRDRAGSLSANRDIGFLQTAICGLSAEELRSMGFPRSDLPAGGLPSLGDTFRQHGKTSLCPLDPRVCVLSSSQNCMAGVKPGGVGAEAGRC